MAAQNTPVTTVVLAIDVPINGVIEAPVKDGFQAFAGKLGPLGYLVAEPAGLALTVTLGSSSVAESSLLALAGAASSFSQSNPGHRVRAVAHYGVVFKSEAEGKVSYVGSAIRGAQTALKRAPTDISLAGTPDFLNMVAGLPQPLSKLNVLRGGIDGSDLCVISLRDASAPAVTATAQGASAAPARPAPGTPSAGANSVAEIDPALVQFLKQRLAAEVGPFAGPLVDKAKRAGVGSSGLISALAQEVSNPAARVKFEMDANAFLRTNGRGR